MSEFLEKSDVKALTGCARKAKQISVLRSQGIQFYINAAGFPVVPKSAINGGHVAEKQETWQSNFFK